MSAHPRRGRRLGAAVVATVCLGSLAVLAAEPAGAGTLDVAPATVENEVLAELAVDDSATFWVYLEDEADLTSAAGITDRADQGWFVYGQLTENAKSSQAGLVAMLDAEGVSYEPFWIANTIQVTGDRDLLERIAARPEVGQITADRVYRIDQPEAAAEENQIDAIEWNVSRVNAPQVWSQFGVTGEDIVVGSIDTGARYDHPALVNQYRGNLGGGRFDHNYNWWDPSNVCGAPSLVPCDNNNHGTHTMGTMVGNDGAANQIGVAPGAKWITAKGCEDRSCSLNALLSSGQFILAPTDLNGQNANPALRPHVVNNSWGGNADTDPWYRPTVQAWVAAGIFPQFSSGNPGSACGAAGNPGNLPESYAAGAFDINNNLYANSGRGPSAFGGDVIKPNIAAPGVSVRSALANGGYGALTGTSMASPHVAGAVALMWSAAPALERDIDATRAILDGTAVDTENLACGGTPSNNNVWGQGKLNAFAAVDESPIPAKGQLAGTVVDATTNAPIAGATVTITGQVERTRRTGADGRYSITLPAGDYSVTASAFAYDPRNASVSVVQGTTVVQGFSLTRPAGPGLNVAPGSLNFGVTEVLDTAGPLTVTLTGTGADPVTVTEVTAPGGDFAPAGGTCGATPVTLSHLQSCTLDYTFRPTVEGPAQATVTVASNAPGSPHSVTLRGLAIVVPERQAATTLQNGENILFSAVSDPDGEYGYFGTQTSPGRVVKVDLDTMQRVGAITLPAGESFLGSAVVDPAGRFAYFGTGTSPGRVVKVDLSTFEHVATITLAGGQNFLRSAVMDPAGRFAYFGTGTSPGQVVKIDLATFSQVGSVTLASGADNLRSAVIDPGGRFAYFGTATAPGVVAKVDLAAFAPVGYVAMATDNILYSAVIDPAGQFAYFGTGTSPARVVKIELANLSRVGAIEMASGENTLLSAVIEPDGDSAYFGTGTSPGHVVKIDLGTFARVGVATLGSGENSLLSAAIDPAGQFAYFGTLSSPGTVVRVQLVPEVSTEIVLSGAGRRDRGQHVVDLTWDGAIAAQIDVFRDGALVATVPNDGTHTDAVGGKGAASYTYQVCHAGTSTCSNEVRVRLGGQSGGLSDG